MTNAITITFPAIPAQVIAELNETETILAATEVEFIRALRAKYGDLARHNGTIRVSHYGVANSNYSDSGDTWLMSGDGSHRVKGLLAANDFDETYSDQNTGTLTGQNLYMVGGTTHTDGWVEITRDGAWSQWQGSPTYWTCDGCFANDREFETNGHGVRWMTDEQVANEYDVKKVADTLAHSLSDLATKLPDRLTRKRALAESLKALTAQLNA